MKTKIAYFALILFFVTQTAFAACKCPGTKFLRGVEGIATFPIEYLNQYQKLSDQNGIIPSSVGAVFAGTAMSVKRLINGVYDIVSFPVKAPGSYGLLLADEDDTALDAYQSLQGQAAFPLGKGTI